MTLFVKPYSDSYFSLWNDFVDSAKNATFLFRREFMTYHKDRFLEGSLLVFENSKIVAILPANVQGGVLISHAGLSYGGLVCGVQVKLKQYMAYWHALLRYLDNQGISKVHVKQIPRIYNALFSDEFDYLLFIIQGHCYRTDVLSVIDQNNRIPISKNRSASIAKGFQYDFYVEEESSFAAFWNDILIPNLKQKHGVSPVHSLQEIQALHELFPKHIRQFNLYTNQDELVAGVTIFETPLVAHIQYISGIKSWNNKGAVDWLHHFLIDVVFKDKKYFDFGTSNEMQGRKINQGLLFWKESFGARSVVQNFYEIQTNQYDKIDKVWS